VKEMYIDIEPADEVWKEQYGESTTRVKIKEDNHFGIVYLSRENAMILRAARDMFKALDKLEQETWAPIPDDERFLRMRKICRSVMAKVEGK
jgi:hypothetical protein